MPHGNATLYNPPDRALPKRTVFLFCLTYPIMFQHVLLAIIAWTVKQTGLPLWRQRTSWWTTSWSARTSASWRARRRHDIIIIIIMITHKCVCVHTFIYTYGELTCAQAPRPRNTGSSSEHWTRHHTKHKEQLLLRRQHGKQETTNKQASKQTNQQANKQTHKQTNGDS